MKPAAGFLFVVAVAGLFNVGCPPTTVTVPNVVGLTWSAAEAALTASELATGTVTEANSETIPSGEIIRQDPAAGTVVPPDSPVSFVVSTGSASAVKASYRFERMWPTLQQPWYFNTPYGLGVDSVGNLYIADTGNNRIQVLTSDGNLVTAWGSLGIGEGQFDQPTGVAADGSGNVYVADSSNNRIQKFSSGGKYLLQWGGEGTENGRFDSPIDVAVDTLGYVYVVEDGNNRIQKFTSDGTFVRVWGGTGSGNGQFDTPEGIGLDSLGNVYVADYGNSRIQKFTSDGVLLATWGHFGTGNGEFSSPSDVAVDASGNMYVADWDADRVQELTPSGTFVRSWGRTGAGDGEFGYPASIGTDSSGNIYVVDSFNLRIQKFRTDGTYVTAWGSCSTSKGFFNWPQSIALNSTGDLYVADFGNDRIQKFNSSGNWVAAWGASGRGNGQFEFPSGVALDALGNVYITEFSGNRVQKFTSSGAFVAKWGSPGTGNGRFDSPEGIAVDSHDNVYVADTHNNRIQKFTSSGAFVMKWGSYGAGDGQFYWPRALAVDETGSVYVADYGNNRIQKFSSSGSFIAKWGSEGVEDGQFSLPSGITIDRSGHVYVVDSSNGRVQVFTSSGAFVGKWGSFGSGDGQMSDPFGIALDPSGNVFVSDTFNSRIQKFRPVKLSSNAKAIVVAGGGAYPGNNLWIATQASANFAYRTLCHQGFTKETIYYLSSDTPLDLDNNGLADDVDADVSNEHIQSALTQWAVEHLNNLPTSDVVVYLVDHGGAETFRINATQALNASELGGWLDQLQSGIQGRLTVIIDACESSSFQTALAAPAGKERIVITSTAAGKPAYFLSQGSISFSTFFWTHTFNGLDVYDSYTLANQSMTQSVNQVPELGGTSLESLHGVFIGNGTAIQSEAPAISAVSGTQTITGTNIAPLWADVTDLDGIARTWAVLRPPDYVPADPSNPVQNLPSVDFAPPADGGNRWSAPCDKFTTSGTYTIAIYAQDRVGNISVPKLTSVSVNSPLRHKAVIVAGGPVTASTWPAVEKGAMAAYEALRAQAYSDEDIRFYSPAGTAGVDGTPVLSNLENALVVWGKADTSDLVVYLIGTGTADAFQLSETETLLPATLQAWLDDAQSTISGHVTVVYDGSFSGGFVAGLAPVPNKTRLLLGSTAAGEQAAFLANGELSFSRFFWQQILNGATVGNAFKLSSQSIHFCASSQTPQLDDSGNGVTNETRDGAIARNHYLGAGILLAGDEPFIGEVSLPQALNGTSQAMLFAGHVISTGTIDRVWAVITSPTFSASIDPLKMVTVELFPFGVNRYEAAYDGFLELGEYTIAFYAMDTHGNVSPPVTTTVSQSMPPG